MNIFEKAVRNKYRFEFKGTNDVEDLWDLSVEELDEIFKELNKKVKTSEEESLLEKKSKEETDLVTKVEIIKYIVKVKQEEAAYRFRAKERAEEKQKILSILQDKQDESLKNMSEEQLKEMLDKLD